MKLKTLKDMYEFNLLKGKQIAKIGIPKEELKQEAIKRTKNLKKQLKINMNDEDYFSISGQIEAFIYFFNITEEDLE